MYYSVSMLYYNFYLQDTRVVGPFLPSPPKPLPDELDRFMRESGDEGVILVSFGTVVDGLDETLLQMMSKAFSKLPQKIIWKLKLKGTKQFDLRPGLNVAFYMRRIKY